MAAHRRLDLDSTLPIPSGAVFIDTGAWVAVQVERDPGHPVAAHAWNHFLATRQPLVTTNLVVGETYTFLRARHGYNAAWRFVDSLEQTLRLLRGFVDPELEREAYSILRRYRDQDFSFVDGTSFAFMRTHRITDAFAFDVHFSIAGFTRIPIDRPLS